MIPSGESSVTSSNPVAAASADMNEVWRAAGERRKQRTSSHHDVDPRPGLGGRGPHGVEHGLQVDTIAERRGLGRPGPDLAAEYEVPEALGQAGVGRQLKLREG